MKLLKHFCFLMMLCSFLHNGQAQSLLVVEKLNADVKNLKFKTGDRIILKSNKNEKIHGYITKIEDSTLTINYRSVPFKEISAIYSERVILRVLYSVGIRSSGAYIVVDSFNNLINNESPVIKTASLKASGIMMGIGLLSGAFKYKKHLVGKDKWRLKVLNYYKM